VDSSDATIKGKKKGYFKGCVRSRVLTPGERFDVVTINAIFKPIISQGFAKKKLKRKSVI
jgi:hypothetical protein